MRGYITTNALRARLINLTGTRDFEHVLDEIIMQLLAEAAIDRFERELEAGEHHE